ncbi:MAG: hypothetical protein OXH96_04900 [Spirochaetaceae bacterium]|nr:hypothetical protein [Spirochaetaceae bacterium]
MTRFASIMGVAAVATLVLLSGCETPMKTDYAKDLAGIWTVNTMATVPNPAAALPGAPATIQIDAAVVVSIVDGEGVNKGTFSLVVTTPGPVDPTTMMPTTMETMGSGSMSVTASEIEVTLATISDTAPADVQGLKGAPVTIMYELSDDELTIKSDILVGLGLMPSLTLKKQMASG